MAEGSMPETATVEVPVMEEEGLAAPAEKMVETELLAVRPK